MDILERAYHAAVGSCLNAALDLRCFKGDDAIAELESAIRTIKEAKRQAERERRASERLVPLRAPLQPPAYAPEI